MCCCSWPAVCVHMQLHPQLHQQDSSKAPTLPRSVSYSSRTGQPLRQSLTESPSGLRLQSQPRRLLRRRASSLHPLTEVSTATRPDKPLQFASGSRLPPPRGRPRATTYRWPRAKTGPRRARAGALLEAGRGRQRTRRWRPGGDTRPYGREARAQLHRS